MVDQAIPQAFAVPLGHPACHRDDLTHPLIGKSHGDHVDDLVVVGDDGLHLGG